MKILYVILTALTAVSGADALFAQQTPTIQVRDNKFAPNFDKEKMSMQLHLLESGGSIEIKPISAVDNSTRDAVRALGKFLDERLRQRDLVCLRTIVRFDPSAAERMKTTGVGFSVEQLPVGIRVDMAASNQITRTAIHDFLRSIDGSRPTAKDGRINHPGNNLGWDAPPARDLEK